MPRIYVPGDEEQRPPDERELEACDDLRNFFNDNPRGVFYSRQIAVAKEDSYFHWVTTRAARRLVSSGFLIEELRPLVSGGEAHLMWHKGNRYSRRPAARVVDLINMLSDHEVGYALGSNGENLVLDGLARRKFVCHGRDINSYRDRIWSKSEHDLDFIFERDGISYGVEVKNTLGYIEREEFVTKLELCEYLGVKPLFVVRMLPKIWINDVISAGGFALILKYQLYPTLLAGLAQTLHTELGLPTGSPRRLEDGTIDRFVNWHHKNL